MPFLDLFEGKYRSMVVNEFLEPIRMGLENHHAIILCVKRDIESRKTRREWIEGYTGKILNVKLKDYWKILEQNLDHPDIGNFLNYYIEYNKPPP